MSVFSVGDKDEFSIVMYIKLDLSTATAYVSCAINSIPYAAL